MGTHTHTRTRAEGTKTQNKDIPAPGGYGWWGDPPVARREWRLLSASDTYICVRHVFGGALCVSCSCVPRSGQTRHNPFTRT